MADTQVPDIVQKAFTALGVQPSGNASNDVNAAMNVLVKMIKAQSPDTQLPYDPNIGYTKELGDALEAGVVTLKKNNEIIALRGLLKFGAGKDTLAEKPGVPEPIQKDANHFIFLIDNVGALTGALDKISDPNITTPSSVPQTSPKPTPTTKQQDEPPKKTEDNETEENPKLTTEEATLIAEKGLVKLTKEINEKLEGVQNPFKDLPFIGPWLAKAFGAPEPLPLPGAVDGKFDRATAYNLQRTLELLRGPHFLGIPVDQKAVPGDELWKYSTEIGKKIAEKIPAFIEKQFPGDKNKEKRKELEGNMNALIRALDTLAAHPEIGPSFTGAPIVQDGDLTHLQKQVLQSAVDDVKPGAHGLLNELMYEMSGYDIEALIKNEEGGNAIPFHTVKDGQSREQRLAELYDKALEAYGGDHAALTAAITKAMGKLKTLPYGSDEKRTNYLTLIKNALNQAEKEKNLHPGEQSGSDGEEATLHPSPAVFAKAFIDDKADPAPLGELHTPREIVWDAALPADFSITSGGQNYNLNDIGKIYSAYNRQNVASWSANQSLVFKADDGTIYMAGIEEKSNIFSIQKIPLEKIEKIINEHLKKSDEILAKIHANNPKADLPKLGVEYRAAVRKVWDKVEEAVPGFKTMLTRGTQFTKIDIIPDQIREKVLTLGQIQETLKNAPRPDDQHIKGPFGGAAQKPEPPPAKSENQTGFAQAAAGQTRAAPSPSPNNTPDQNGPS